jgi:hypothetical protein
MGLKTTKAPMMPSMLTFDSEATAEHLRGLQASADLIASLIAANERTDEALATMDRNVRHIAIMCAMQHIKDSGADLTPFTQAASDGLEWIG